MKHYSEEDLVLHYYGENRRAEVDVDRHLEACASCAATFREITGTLAMVTAPEVPERGDQYGLEVWQRIRHNLPDQDVPWWVVWMRPERLAFAASVALLVVAAFVAGRVWPRQPVGTPAAPDTVQAAAERARAGSDEHRILLTSVADHLDRSARVLTDIMNASNPGDISSEQAWADDLVSTSRLYRQDAVQAGEQSIATVLDDLERSLIEIVHSPSRISAADLEQIRRRIDATALLFKVRVLSDELRQRDVAPDVSGPRTSTRKTS